MKLGTTLAIVACVATSLLGCGKSAQEIELERSVQRERDRAKIAQYQADAAKMLASQQAEIDQKRAAETAQSAAAESERVAVESSRLQEELKQVLVSRLKDPASVQFASLKMNNPKTALCGEYNAKNGFGGYGGFKQFIVTSDRKLMINDRNDSSFDGSLSNLDYLLAVNKRICD